MAIRENGSGWMYGQFLGMRKMILLFFAVGSGCVTVAAAVLVSVTFAAADLAPAPVAVVAADLVSPPVPVPQGAISQPIPQLVNPILPTKEKSIQPFALRNVDGTIWCLDSQNSAKGFIVIFTCNHCPFASLYPSRFNALQAEFAPKGVPVIAVNSMDSALYEDESFVKMQAKAKVDGFVFPYLQDASQAVGKQFGAEHTPQCYVIWKENGKYLVKYSGAIDDNGEDAAKAHSFVAAAVKDLLSNKPVTQPQTESFGCRIIYRRK